MIGRPFFSSRLPPGKGIPIHSHPYAEVFYVIMGHIDFVRINGLGAEEWERCGVGIP